MTDIKNSSGKVTGFTIIEPNKITIHNNTKPELYITNLQDIISITKKNRDDNFILHLYDDYFLNPGEIASLYNVCYANVNKQLKTLEKKTSPKAGRRNRSYGKTQSDEAKKNISQGVQKASQDGKYDNVAPYERTDKIKKQISDSLISYYKDNPQDPTPHRENWEKGVYAQVDFHRGIGGSIYSIKNQKKIFFRSLLELVFMLKLEEDEGVKDYSYEPLHIQCDDGTSYTPDFQVGDTIVELKSKRYIEKMGGQVLARFYYKKKQGEKYCAQKGLEYKVIFDEDIDFDSRRTKRFFLNHPEIITQYQIIFNQPERMVIK